MRLIHKHSPVSGESENFILDIACLSSLTLPLVTESGDVKVNYTFFTLFRVARYWSKDRIVTSPLPYNM
jgi:hypothetical protein